MQHSVLFLAFVFCFSLCAAQDCGKEDRDRILSYWFGELREPDDYPAERSKIWFNGGPQVDQEIRDRFEALVLAAGNHELDAWKSTPQGRLALILLLDQFPRNLYRGKPEAFAYDSLALQLTVEGLCLGVDKRLLPIERTFFYLPLEHAEDLDMQKLSVTQFDNLAREVPETLTPVFESFANYAWEHYETIKRFGRFPYRNAALGRISTPQELEFLNQKHP